MAEGSRTVVGVFDDYDTAHAAVEDLVRHGIPRHDIDIESNFSARRKTERERGFFDWLFGSNEEDDEERGDYAEAVRRGSAVVSVTAAPAVLDSVVTILNNRGASDIDRRVEAYREAGFTRFDPKAPAYTAEEAARERDRFRTAARKAIPVVEEELQVGKRAIRRGGVRIYSRVIEEPVQKDVTLREEHVRVERRPVDRPVSPADTAKLRDQSIEMEETAEEPVVAKQARVKEEVLVGKETAQRTERIKDTVKRTEVDVEHEGARDWATVRDDFRRHYDTIPATTRSEWSTMEPAYQYGYRMANDPRYRGKSWAQVEADMRANYEREYPDSRWERAKDAVRYSWERDAGRR
jgi:uncharacterized protein (TIGR02271 family)